MGEPSATKKQLYGADVHVYKAGKLYRKDLFFTPKRPCSVSLKGTILSVSDAARHEHRTHDLTNSTLMMQPQSMKIVIDLENRERLHFFAAHRADLLDWMAVLADSIHWKLQRYYDVGEHLGQGAFATVAKGLCKRTGDAVAIKIIDKTACSDEDFKYLQREIDITQRLHHPNVVRTVDLFESRATVFIVLEYVGGGTLQSFRESHRSLGEHHARSLMRDIFNGLEYVHSKKVAHRDIKVSVPPWTTYRRRNKAHFNFSYPNLLIFHVSVLHLTTKKPENILCTAKGFPTTAKLMDFGLARNLNPYAPKSEDRYDYNDNIGPDELMSTPVGTPKFVAPEVLMCNPYGKEIDLFACGGVMYWLLCGYSPFDHPDIDTLIEKIKRTEFEFPDADWASVSEEAKDLISKLLSHHPHDRPTATEALQFAWFDIPEKLEAETRPVNGENDEKEVDSRKALPRPSRSGSVVYQLSRASDIDDVDDISEVIRLTSDVTVSGNGTSTS